MEKKKLKKFLKGLAIRKPIEIDSNSEDWYAIDFLNSLYDIRNNLKNGLNPNRALVDFILHTSIFLELLSLKEDSEIIEDISQEYWRLGALLRGLTIGKEIKTDQKAMAVGQFVQDLVYFGMPRLPAIKDTAKCLGISQVTVRKYNEEYRKRYNIKKGNKPYDFDGRIKWLNIKQAKKIIEKCVDFPLYHPKSEKALSQVMAAYKAQILKRSVTDRA